MFFNQNYNYKRKLKLYKKYTWLTITGMTLGIMLALSKKYDANYIDEKCYIIEIKEDPISDEISTQIEEEIETIDNRELVALTFDDGPGKYTNRLLDILKENGITATFFIVGSSIHKYPEVLIRMSNEGHDIGLHSYNHDNFSKMSIEEINNDLNKELEEFNNLGIVTNNFVRPPYGSINDDIKENLDYSFILWSVDTEDWKSRDKDKVISEVNEHIEPGAIILFHDVHESTVDAIEELLPELCKDYKFVTVSELYELNNIDMEQHKIYSKVKKK